MDRIIIEPRKQTIDTRLQTSDFRVKSLKSMARSSDRNKTDERFMDKWISEKG